MFEVSLYDMKKYVPIRPDSKVHGANMGPIRDRQDPGGPHVGHMDFAITAISSIKAVSSCNSRFPIREIGVMHTFIA